MQIQSRNAPNSIVSFLSVLWRHTGLYMIITEEWRSMYDRKCRKCRANENPSASSNRFVKLDYKNVLNNGWATWTNQTARNPSSNRAFVSGCIYNGPSIIRIPWWSWQFWATYSLVVPIEIIITAIIIITITYC